MTISLSHRQGQILACKERGFSNKEIASELGVSVSTVKTHVKKVFEKTGASSSAMAVYNARQALLGAKLRGPRAGYDLALAPLFIAMK